MTHSEQEEILRRALHAVADQIEPAADGLERIRERLSRPRPLAVAWLMAAWTGLAQPLLLRIEPVLAGAAGWLSDRLAEWLRLMIRSMKALGERLRPAGVRLRLGVERLRPLSNLLVDAIRMLRPGSGMSRHEKLRAALAFGAAALIGVTGGFALSDGLPPVITTLGGVFPSNPQNHPGSAGHSTGLSKSAQRYPSTSSGTPGSRHKPGSTPRPACTRTPHPSPDPTPTPPTSTSPTPTPPTSTSPTPTPPTSTSPTPTPQNQQAPGSGPSAASNASASAGSRGTVPTVRQNPPGGVNPGSGQTRPGAATAPTTRVPAKPTPPAPSPGCSS